MTPFEQFFAGEFQQRLNAVQDVAGALTDGAALSAASWDRKAAWLLWCALDRAAVLIPSTLSLDDLL